MQIIVTHRNADFDALACQIAATKIYPGAVKVGTGRLSPVVRQFLALHKDHFELTPVKEIDQLDVSRLIVVDVRRASRLKDFAPLLKRASDNDPSLEVHVFDHHDNAPDDLSGQLVQVEPVGAATTLLVEKIVERTLPVTPIEATALALGVYSDTGSLTFPNTTPRDAAAAAFLLQRGASMNSLRYFLHTPLSAKQRQILTALLSQTATIEFCGVKIGVRTVELDKPVSGLSEIVNEALVLEGHEAIFALFPRGKNVTVIARTWVPSIDVGAIMQKLGGGGHHEAGSATLKKTSIGRAKARLMAVLNANPPKPYRVRYLMTTPVHVLTPDQILREVDDDFKRRNISGAPVLKEGRLVGMVSKRDIRSAARGERDHLPVSSCMVHEVETISPDASLVRAFELMMAKDIGRLPVIDGGNLVGIITRNDILGVLYPETAKAD